MINATRSAALCMTFVLVIACGCTPKDGPPGWELLSFSPDHKFLVAAGGEWMASANLKVWNSSTWRVHAEWKKVLAGQIQGSRFDSDNVFVTFSGKPWALDKRRYYGNEMQFWNIAEKKQMEKVDLENSRGFADGLDYFPKKRIIVFTHRTNAAAGVYTIPKLEKQIEIGNDLQVTTRCRFAPDGEKVMSIEGSLIRMFDVANGKLLAQRKLDKANAESSCQDASFSPNGSMIAVSLAKPDKIYVVSSDLERAILTIDRPSPFVAFSPDSQFIAVLNGANATELISIGTQETTKVFKGVEGLPSRCCFSHDGKMIAVSYGNKVRVFDVLTCKLVAELE